VNAARHPVLLGACLALLLLLGTPFGAPPCRAATTRDLPSKPAAVIPDAVLPASVIDENGGDREPVLPVRLAPSAESSAETQTLYARAVRLEIEQGTDASLPLYLEVLARDPSFVSLYLKLGLGYIEEKKPAEAAALLEKGVAANPKAGELAAGLAYARYSAGDYAAASTLAQQAKALVPFSPLAHRIAFESLRDQGQTPAALDLAKAAAVIPGGEADDWAALAHLYTELIAATGELPRDQAAALILPLYDKAFASGTPSTDLLRQRGEFSLFLDHKEEAYSYLKRAADDGSTGAPIDLRLATLASALNRQAEALGYYEKAYALEPDFPQLREVLALQYIRTGQDKKAIALLEETVRRSPTRTGIYTSLGDLYAESNQLQKAEFNYRQAIALGATQQPDYLKLAMTLLRRHHFEEAAKLLHDTETRFPDSPRVAFLQGIVQRELKNPAEALNRFAQAKLLAEGHDDEFINGQYYYELSVTQEQAGQMGPSEESLKAGLALEPNNESLLNALAYSWAEQGKNLPEALKYSLQSLDNAPGRGEFIDTLGWIYYRMGRYDEASEALKRAAALTDNDPIVVGHLADAYLKLGRRADAEEAYRMAVAKDPDDVQARKKLENFLSGKIVLSTKNAVKSNP
jgi:tetratricopeptide (TPR) repeat protein